MEAAHSLTVRFDCGQVMISMSKELPVVVQYRIEDMGHIRCTPIPCLEPNICPYLATGRGI